MRSRAIPYDHLHLGCGLKTPRGWLNVDGSWQVFLARHSWMKRILVALRLLPPQQAELPWNANVLWLNLTKPLPFPAGSFRAIFCSHTLEHLHRSDALALLRECHRVLQPKGVCRFIVPDLWSVIERYLVAKDRSEDDAADRLMEELLVHAKERRRGILGLYYRLTAFHSHKWMYDAESLQAVFRAAGFRCVRSAKHLDSAIDRIHEVEEPGRILEGQGVAVEGIKA